MKSPGDAGKKQEMVTENLTMEQAIGSFADIISSFLRELIHSPGFLTICLKNQLMTHHLCFLCDLVRDTGQDLDLILQEHGKIMVNSKQGNYHN